MTTQTEALKLALEALEVSTDWDVNATGKQLKSMQAITALRKALVQPEQEPKCKTHPDAPHGFVRNSSHTQDRYVCECEFWEPPQPEQEPVAYIKAAELEELKHCNGMSLWAENAAIHTEDSISKQLLPSGHVPVYTTPPQRKPLTDEQILTIARDHYNPHQRPEVSFARAIEAAHGIKE